MLLGPFYSGTEHRGDEILRARGVGQTEQRANGLGCFVVDAGHRQLRVRELARFGNAAALGGRQQCARPLIDRVGERGVA
jgi:hypothetical protein